MILDTITIDRSTFRFFGGQAPRTRAELESLVGAMIDFLTEYPTESAYSAALVFEPRKMVPPESGVTNRAKGFVYLMRNQRNGFVKIGFSKAPQYREATLQSEEPEIVLEQQFAGSPMDEKELHEHFRGKRVRGEWFRLGKEDVDWITRQMASDS